MFDTYPTFLQNSVLWPTIGNHEVKSTDSSGQPPYFTIFTLPQNGEAGGVASGTEKYYSFDYANIHFVCLDSMTSDRRAAGPMCSRLRADLAATTQDWLIAFFHHPPYSKGSHDSDAEIESIEMRQNFLPLLESYDVDLVLCGPVPGAPGNLSATPLSISRIDLAWIDTATHESGILVEANDDFEPGVWSEVEFDAVAGTPYQIAVDGYVGETGSVILTITISGVLPP